jgi:type III pantothenate kinase
MKNFLIDIGNSAIKTCTANFGSLSVGRVSRHEYDKRFFIREFEHHIKSESSYEVFARVGISLLDKNLRKPISRVIRKYFDQDPYFIGPDSRLPFKLQYSKTIGSDRLCSSSAAKCLSDNITLLTIDFGTATTYTVINKSKLIGGMISPGVGTSYSSLISKTTLPETILRFPKSPISSNTQDNISGGVLYQSLYSTERFIEEIRKKFGDTFVFCTGGFSKLIKSKTELINKLDRNLVLKGINIIISK